MRVAKGVKKTMKTKTKLATSSVTAQRQSGGEGAEVEGETGTEVAFADAYLKAY